MQPIPKILKRRIAPDNRIGYEFKIDPVPVTADGIANDPHTIALPAMNAITALLLFFASSLKYIILNNTVEAVLSINPEKGILENIIFDDYISAFINFYATDVLQT